jgi:pimeloyl-ACP methyl ester carboxylesterase
MNAAHAHDNQNDSDLIATLEGAVQRHDVAFDGGHVAWRKLGEGPPLVLLHGGHGSWLHWVRNMQPLAEQHSVWVPDLPGYGASAAPAEPTLESLLEATLSTLVALIGSTTPVALVGFSFGGLVAAHLAARRAAASRLSVSSLALLGPGGHGGPRRPRGELRSWRAEADAQDSAALSAVMRHNLLMHMLHGDEAVDAQALRIHTEACVNTRFRSKPISRAAVLAPALARYQGPLLLAWGEHDVTAEPPAAALALSQGRARCATHIVPGAGHWVQYESAEALNALLAAWLDETTTKETT